MTNEFFTKLNYSLGNEDTGLETALVKKFNSKNILTVCGSGSRALPLLHVGAEKLICVDVAKQQTFLLQLRIATYKQLDHNEFLKFWGYAPFVANSNQEWRKEKFHQLDLTKEAFEYLELYFKNNEWSSLLYQGSWERTFLLFSSIIKILMQDHCEKLFQFTNLEEQKNYFKNNFPWARWNFIMLVLGNRTVFNSLLYKGCFIKKNVSETHFEYYASAYKRLFYNDLTKKSFFLQLCFLGNIKYAEGNLNEAHENVFHDIKKSLTRIEPEIVNDELLSVIKSNNDLDYISLSDVPSYFSGDVEKNFLQEIRPHIKIGGIVVNRNYLRIPNCDRSGYEDISSEYSELLAMEKVQMYRVEILRKTSR